jgi:glycerol-3-phosphate dehydrogenase
MTDLSVLNPDDVFDLVVVGGGINGTGIARDAAGRGLKVLLAERDDLASHTSSASTKLIHGGLRYLEYYEFRLVREALQERERLIHIAPHISWPMRFVLPQPKGGRPGWMIRIGLWLYDHIGGRQSLPRSHAVRLNDTKWGAGLKPAATRGFVYSDAWVDDARLVVLNAMDAAEHGAKILLGAEMTGARIEDGLWRIDLSPNTASGRPAIANPTQVRARAIVNAAGPWVASLLDRAPEAASQGALRLVKGSHIVVPRLYPGEHAFILQNDDKRIVFTIPYEDRFTLVGTTDVVVGQDERDKPKISEAEIEYLCATVNAYFQQQVSPSDVVSTYSGVRPLWDDGAAEAKAVTRDYVLKLGRESAPQILSVYGGKLTTYRRLAEHALELLSPFLPKACPAWTGQAPLPGGDLGSDFATFLDQVRQRYPFLPADVAQRMAHAYGARIAAVLGGASQWADLGQDFGGGLTEVEAVYLVDHEWARTAQDILWRRSKIGLSCPPETEAALSRWLTARMSHGG